MYKNHRFPPSPLQCLSYHLCLYRGRSTLRKNHSACIDPCLSVPAWLYWGVCWLAGKGWLIPWGYASKIMLRQMHRAVFHRWPGMLGLNYEPNIDHAFTHRIRGHTCCFCLHSWMNSGWPDSPISGHPWEYLTRSWPSQFTDVDESTCYLLTNNRLGTF